MIIRLTARGEIELEERSNFQRFHLAVSALPEVFDRIRDLPCQLIRFENRDVSWVSIGELQHLIGLEERGLQQEFSAMITKARLHGWVSADGSEVRAHVEWETFPKERERQ